MPGPSPRPFSKFRLTIYASLVTAGTLTCANGAIEWLERAGLVETYDVVDGMQTLAEPVWERQTDLWQTSRYGRRTMAQQSFQDRQHQGSDSTVFVLGGSWAMGWPFANGGDRALEGTFPYFIEQGLLGRQGAPVQVVNAGGAGHDSNKVLAIAKESLRHRPDALVVASCNNEGLDLPAQSPLHSWLLRQAGYRLLVRILGAHPNTTAVRSQQPSLDEGELQLRLQSQLKLQYEENLRAIVSAAEHAGVPVLLLTVPLNLTHKYLGRLDPVRGGSQKYPDATFLEELTGQEPPLRQQVPPCSAAMYLFEAPTQDEGGLSAFANCIADLRETGRDELAREFILNAAAYYLGATDMPRADKAREVLAEALGPCATQGIELYLSGRYSNAIEQLSKCDRHSPVLPWAGLAELGAGDTEAARQLLLQAAERDSRGRCRPSYNNVIRKIAADSPNAHLVDLEQAAAPLGGPPSTTPLFLDSCHMTWQGYRVMANETKRVLAPLLNYTAEPNSTAEAWALLHKVPTDLHQQIGYAHLEGMMLDRLPAIDDSGPGDDDDSGTGDDDDSGTGDDDDSATGEDDDSASPEDPPPSELTGQLFDEETGAAIGGVTVTEFETTPTNAVTTDASGSFLLVVKDPFDTDIQFHKSGYVDILLAGRTKDLVDNATVLVPNALVSEIYEEDFGAPFDPSKAIVEVYLVGPEPEFLRGVSVDLEGEYAGAWVEERKVAYEWAEGEVAYEPGNAIPEESKTSSVTFTGVVPGTVGLSVTLPGGVGSCDARKELVIPAGHLVFVKVPCSI